MIKNQPLVSVTVIHRRLNFRRGRIVRFGSFASALESVRPWVGFGEAMRIFETSFGIRKALYRPLDWD